MHDGVRVDLGDATKLEQQVRFGDHMLAHERDAVDPRQLRAAADQRHLQPQSIPGHDLTPELGVVHAAQEDPQAAAFAQSSSSTVDACASASIISTPGIVGRPGKCPWKNSSLTVTFLAATTRRPGSC